MSQFNNQTDSHLDLVLERMVDIPPELIWAAWTKPEHIKNWFTPAPWKTIDCEIDLRPGGIFRTTMLSPEGKKVPSIGCVLEVIENKKLVWTDALTPGFRPSEKPFITGIITLESHGSSTKYTARALHKDEADKKKHEEMGFAQGWDIALNQLVAYMKTVHSRQSSDEQGPLSTT